MWPRQVPFIRRPFQIALLIIYCLFDAKLFEPKSKKVARLTAELAALEADRLSKLVVVFGYEVSVYLYLTLSSNLNNNMQYSSNLTFNTLCFNADSLTNWDSIHQSLYQPYYL